jgi:hypothetical protein
VTKIGSDRITSKTATVRATITLEQKNIIEKLIGVLGSNEQDVVSKILTLWIYNEGFLKNKMGSQNKQNNDKSGGQH